MPTGSNRHATTLWAAHSLAGVFFAQTCFPRETIISFLVDRLRSAGISEAYIIGSFAEDRCEAWSDIDLIILQETTRPFTERAQGFQNLFDLGLPLDILVYTPAEFTRLLNSTSGFWKAVRLNNLRFL